MNHEKQLSAAPPVTFVRRLPDGKYEHGHILLGLTRSDDEYVRIGLVGSYDAAANAAKFEPAAKHNPGSNTFYGSLHSRNFGGRQTCSKEA